MPRFFLLAGLLVSSVGGTWSLLLAGSSASRPAGHAASTAGTAAAARFEMPGFDRPAETAAPIQLTASDGTGLKLVALEANGALEPPLAFTELHLTFENPRDARIEGRFRIALPPGAALSRFAMKGVGGEWQEGEVVERRRARLVYEDYLHRRQDPALLEQEAGNEFSARVFPIPPRGRKELIVSYSHALVRADQPYVIPLRGLSEVGSLDLRVLLGDLPAGAGGPGGKPASNLGGEVSDRRMVELHKRDWTPDRDFEVGQEQVAGRDGLRHANLAVVRVAAPVEEVRQEVGGLYVLIDSSASRALGYREQVRRLAELIGGLQDEGGGGRRLGVAAFDQEVALVYDGELSGFGAAEAHRLLERRPLGATDLNRALAWLAGRLARGGGREVGRVLLVTDGVATAGETEPRALKAAVRALGAAGVERLDVLAAGGLRDEAVLRELTTGNLAQDGARIDGSASGEEIRRRLTLACRSGIAVTVEGAAWVWPETLDGMQPGDAALVYAELPPERAMRLSLGGREVALPGRLADADAPLLERAVAQARIERLLHLRESALAGDDDMRRALGIEIVELSVEHRVLSPFTAMLVLESDYDYARFGLDRRALADILTVGPGGLETLARSRRSPRETDIAAGATAERKSFGGRDQTYAPPAPPPATVARRGVASEVAGGPGGVAGGMPGEPPTEADILVAGEAAPGAGGMDGVPGGVAGGVVGGVAGGVSGGVPGGVAGGVGASGHAVSEVTGESGGGAAGNTPLPRVAAASPAVPAIEPRGRGDERAVHQFATPEGRVDESVVAGESAQGSSGEEDERWSRTAPYSGRFAAVMAHLAAGRVVEARALAEAWSAEAPGDVLALVALGEAWEAAGEKAAAARAYGSLIDLFPSRADLRRLAAERLERLGDEGLELAIDSYEKAVAQRPDHPSGHRLLAWARLRAGRFAAAFAALERGLEQDYPGGRFLGVDRVLREDLGLIAAAWLREEPGRRQEVLDRLRDHGARLATEPSLRFVLTWETDANDVDLHVYDRQDGHAYYRHRQLPSGGELFADVTTGYGPECFAVSEPAGRGAAPYRLRVHYYSRGPMGYGMGTVQVVAHDGAGGLTVEPRPFVVMADNAMLDLGLAGEGKARRRAGARK
ncbi:MAG TPA: VIT domain-containing protein [Thermoanaerobaculia bacterium]|nr:VIT domain-containing protein [Thermoanaerobaculia bacterium]